MRQPTLDEMIMIRDMIVLPNVVAMLEHKREEMECSQELLKPLYLRALDALIYMTNRELSQARIELRGRQIKTWGVETSDFVHHIKYNCRGYTSQFDVTREVIKAELQLRLTGYIKEMGEALHAHIQDRDYRPTRPEELKDAP